MHKIYDITSWSRLLELWFSHTQMILYDSFRTKGSLSLSLSLRAFLLTGESRTGRSGEKKIYVTVI